MLLAKQDLNHSKTFTVAIKQNKKNTGFRSNNNLNWKNFSTQCDIQNALMAFKSLNPLSPSIYIQILQTDLYTFP